MEIIDNTALKLYAPPEVIHETISNVEKAERLSPESMLVCWDYHETRYVAARLDEFKPDDSLPDIPSPMLRDYDWPGVYRPFEHQKDTASFLSLRKRAFCFNEAGTGKTSAAIWAADYLMKLGIVRRVLVICPLTIMHTAWQNDIFHTAMHRSCAVAHGSRQKRVKVIEGGYEFVIINYDGIDTVRSELQRAGFDLIIVDEANAYKNSSTKRWKNLAHLITSNTYLWMMTGTPASQSPEDAFGLARLISPQRVPKFKTAWRDRVMMQVRQHVFVPKITAKQDVFNALQPAIRYTKEECLDLPDIVYQTRDIPLTAQVHHYYKRLKSQLLIEAGGVQISAVNAAVSISKLLQISGGAVYSDDKEVVEFDVSPRLNALEEVLDETSNKVIVFVPFTHTIDIIEDHLNSKGYVAEVINGDVSAGNRADIITRFQTQPTTRVLIIQPQAASHGVTLTAADTIVFWSPVMSVETYLQCVARINRVGQKNKMTVVHLQGSDIERKVYKMMHDKVDYHQRLVDLYSQELGA